MDKIDWYKIKFLESASNLKRLVKEVVGREPSTRVAREIAVCLQQGRLFFEAAATSPLEIRPLQLFYGMVGFSKAITIARSMQSLETLSQSHGLRDVSAQNSRIEELCVKIQGNGTFQEFNDQVGPLNRLCYFAESDSPVHTLLPSATSDDLSKVKLTLKDILSRIIGIKDLYQHTFRERANTHHISIIFYDCYDDYCVLRIDDPELFTDRASLKANVEKWREAYPFLCDWRIERATLAWGNSIIEFCNVEKTNTDEFSEDSLTEGDNGFEIIPDLRISSPVKRIDFLELLAPLSGGYGNSNPNMVTPFNSLYISEYSLQYMGMFLLSSVVRYRPNTWVHAISRLSSEVQDSDDHTLALVERFMEICSETFPVMIVKAMNPYEDKYRLTRRPSGR